MKSILCILLFLCACNVFLCACSIPNLEPVECSQAREAVKDFYSYHFAENMAFSEEKLKSKRKYLTERFAKELENVRTDADVFTTGNTDFPKAFRIGKCELINNEKASVEVLLFWKDENRSEQRAIKVLTVKKDNSWLIDEIKR